MFNKEKNNKNPSYQINTQLPTEPEASSLEQKPCENLLIHDLLVSAGKFIYSYFEEEASKDQLDRAILAARETYWQNCINKEVGVKEARKILEQDLKSPIFCNTEVIYSHLFNEYHDVEIKALPGRIFRDDKAISMVLCASISIAVLGTTFALYKSCIHDYADFGEYNLDNC
ncbi:MAG: hypothetical protein SFT93_01490 [Rickettsiaceae bacterium]|nr:hypothetical protein [Rickettsiaceae bacterium]